MYECVSCWSILSLGVRTLEAAHYLPRRRGDDMFEILKSDWSRSMKQVM